MTRWFAKVSMRALGRAIQSCLQGYRNIRRLRRNDIVFDQIYYREDYTTIVGIGISAKPFSMERPTYW